MSEFVKDRRERSLASSSRSESPSMSAATRARVGLSHESGSPVSRRVGPHLNPFGFNARVGRSERSNVGSDQGSDAIVSATRVMRQQFRERCQAVMARDRQRDRARLLQVSRASSCHSHSDGAQPSSDDLQSQVALNSDELGTVSSDGGMTPSSYGWDEEDEEIVRRVMTSEYRRMLQEQEQAGRIELGWLGPDEVAWLEDELRREEHQARQQLSLSEIEPPPDLEDEDDMLCDMFEHAQRQGQHKPRGFSGRHINLDDDDDEDYSWVNEVDLTGITPMIANDHMDIAS